MKRRRRPRWRWWTDPATWLFVLMVVLVGVWYAGYLIAHAAIWEWMWPGNCLIWAFAWSDGLRRFRRTVRRWQEAAEHWQDAAEHWQALALDARAQLDLPIRVEVVYTGREDPPAAG